MFTVIIQRYWSDEAQSLGTMTLLDTELNPVFASISLEGLVG